jgi:predicted peptidase
MLFLPRDYAKDPHKKWPLIMFLHGSGERGSDLEKVKGNSPAKLGETEPDFPFIVVSPQCPEDDWWSNDVLISLLDSVQKKYRVDADRVYLTGLSMGGYGVWALATEYPDRFAAIAPISGAGYSDCANRLKHLPIWVFHGAKDKLVPPSEAQDMYDTIKKAGGDIQLTMYPDAGHNVWTRTYQNKELYVWFLAHKREHNGK